MGQASSSSSASTAFQTSGDINNGSDNTGLYAILLLIVVVAGVFFLKRK